MKKSIIILFALIVLSSCLLTYNNKQTIDFLLENAVDTLEIDDAKYVFDVFTYRDFFPGDSQDHSLRSSNTLFRIDSLEIPSHMNMVKQYVIHEDSLWTTNYIDRIDSLSSYKIRRTSIGGPEWELKSFVDVVSKIKYSNTEYYLIKRNVEIQMTW